MNRPTPKSDALRAMRESRFARKGKPDRAKSIAALTGAIKQAVTADGGSQARKAARRKAKRAQKPE